MKRVTTFGKIHSKTRKKWARYSKLRARISGGDVQTIIICNTLLLLTASDRKCVDIIIAIALIRDYNCIHTSNITFCGSHTQMVIKENSTVEID